MKLQHPPRPGPEPLTVLQSPTTLSSRSFPHT